MAKPKNKPLKRFNGQGTVYKMSGRRKKPWVAVITIGWDKLGDVDNPEERKSRQNREILDWYETETEAKNALLMYNAGLIPKKAEITLKQLYDEWSESKYKYLKKGTTDGYKAAWKRLEVYKDIQFIELRSSHFQDIIDKAFEDNMSRSSMEKIKAVALMLYDYAMQNDIINKNYASFVNLPKVEKEEKEIFTDLEIKKIFDNVDNVKWLDTVLILIYTGMRITEMLELTKFNVDIENKLITGGIKTEAGKNRIIPIHAKIYPYVKKWYDSNGDTLIHDEGKSLTDRAYREERYRKALKAIGVRELNPHSCRHTFASLMAKAGVDTLYIQKIIGHADYATTANIYTHPEIEELKNAITKMQ